jgi:hypothetical protein
MKKAKERTMWEEMVGYLPKGWEAAARREGAITRSRKIQSAEDLLQLCMLYLTQGGSYQTTSILVEMAAGIRLNKNAVRKRIQRSHLWLQWMAKGLLQSQGIGVERPSWLEGKRVLLTDASDMALQGSSGADYRLHYALDLFQCACAQLELTTCQEGEKLGRYEVVPGDIHVADRGYCSIQGMEHVRNGGGDFVIRYRNKAFTLYSETGERMELLPLLRGLKVWEAKGFNAAYRLLDGTLRPIRVVAVRKDEENGDQARTKQERTGRRKGRSFTKETQEMTQYIVLLTSLEETPERVAELYRARWQIEQVFRRLKSLFAFGEVPGKNPESIKAWFYGKLLVAALCETVAKDISPNGPSDPQERGLADGTLPLA